MGDPAGIGPEIIARALIERPDLIGRLVVVGDLETLVGAAKCVALQSPGRVPVFRTVDSLSCKPVRSRSGLNRGR
jgi:4-hydroxy-L-threonine phosphate dehydrogenase PdxA